MSSTSTPTENSDSPPVTITEPAATQARTLMQQESMDVETAGVRLYVQQGGCAGLSYGMRFEHDPEPDDSVVTQHDVRIFIDEASLDYIDGSTFKYDGGLQGAGFHVDNPNVVSECGCGESFRT